MSAIPFAPFQTSRRLSVEPCFGATHLIVRPTVTLHAYRFDGEESAEGLRDLVVETGFADLFNVDVVCFLRDLDLFTGDLAEDTDR